MQSIDYSEFTPEERLQLTLAAVERGDQTEVEQLMSSCPQVPRVVLDPRYFAPLTSLLAAVSAEIILWMDVSTFVLLSRLAVESAPGKDAARRAKAKAGWKTASAVWRGIEVGIRSFCADADLTCDQLLALAGGRPEAVEWAGQMLHPDARASGRCAKAVRDRLWQAWQVGSEE